MKLRDQDMKDRIRRAHRDKLMNQIKAKKEREEEKRMEELENEKRSVEGE